MSGQWEGFTEEDIKQIGIGGPKVIGKRTAQGVKPTSIRHQTKKNGSREPKTQSLTDTCRLSEGKLLLTDPAHESLLGPADSGTLSNMNCTTAPIPPLAINSEPLQQSTPPQVSPNHIPVCIRIKDGRSYEVIETPKISLEDFQKRQKLMEEQNRHRKELLGRALANRKKQTHAESQRLQQIQEELQKLDSLLSNDVSILRNQIEVASLEFNEAQKRYNKAEKEFLDAKMVMYGKLEQKELLTEHLCTIIEQNEMRKAKKLSELMDKLELGSMVVLNNVTDETHGVTTNEENDPQVGILTSLPTDSLAEPSAAQSPESFTETGDNSKSDTLISDPTHE